MVTLSKNLQLSKALSSILVTEFGRAATAGRRLWFCRNRCSFGFAGRRLWFFRIIHLLTQHGINVAWRLRCRFALCHCKRLLYDPKAGWLPNHWMSLVRWHMLRPDCLGITRWHVSQTHRSKGIHFTMLWWSVDHGNRLWRDSQCQCPTTLHCQTRKISEILGQQSNDTNLVSACFIKYITGPSRKGLADRTIYYIFIYSDHVHYRCSKKNDLPDVTSHHLHQKKTKFPLPNPICHLCVPWEIPLD